jgi:beta-glucanase (GH16 family)
MKNLKIGLSSFLCVFIIISCTKADDLDIIPSNLVINADISTGGSGIVAFTAKADNAVMYDFEFGDGEVKRGTSGIVGHTYRTGGINTYTVKVIAMSNTGKTVTGFKDITVTVSGEQGVIWSDEFNTEGAPDPSKWGYDIGTGTDGWGNNELEYYTSRPDNAVISNGVLKITARKEEYNGSAYTSAKLVTRDKFAFTYGRVEVRAKLPAGIGTWPAIWMLGSNAGTVGWPACGELDIMEHKGSELNKIYGTLHYPGRSGDNADGSTGMIENATSEFHTYMVDWSAAAIKIYVDSELLHTVINSQALPFNHDFFIILNLAMGGNFAGPVDPSFSSAMFEIDYIRVYNK